MKRTLRWAIAAVIPAVVPAGTVLATALDTKASGNKTFYIDPRVGANQVVSSSEAAVEDITSVINTVTGELQLNPRNLEDTKGKLSVRVTDIHTGIDLRDKDLQGPEWLDAVSYPLITITITGARDIQKKSANSASMTFTGTCDVHGVSHDVQIPATLIYMDESAVTQQRALGDLVVIRANYQFKLSDYKIGGPTDSERAIGQKVADAQSVRITVFASSQPPPLDGHGGMAPPTGTTHAPGSRPAASQLTAPGTPALPSPPGPSGGR